MSGSDFSGSGFSRRQFRRCIRRLIRCLVAARSRREVRRCFREFERCLERSGEFSGSEG